MPSRFPALSVVAATLGAAAAAVSAQTALQLSSPSDLGNLTVGDTVRIDVSLAGLPGPAQLELLAAAVDFNPAVFGTPTSVSPGQIVPDPNSFEGFADVGSVTGLFESFDGGSAGRIGDDGRFFSFNLTVAGAGSGLISLDVADALRFDPDNPLEPTEVDLLLGPGLSFTAVPEPSALAAVGLAGLVCLARARRVGGCPQAGAGAAPAPL